MSISVDVHWKAVLLFLPMEVKVEPAGQQILLAQRYVLF